MLFVILTPNCELQTANSRLPAMASHDALPTSGCSVGRSSSAPDKVPVHGNTPLSTFATLRADVAQRATLRADVAQRAAAAAAVEAAAVEAAADLRAAADTD